MAILYDDAQNKLSDLIFPGAGGNIINSVFLDIMGQVDPSSMMKYRAARGLLTRNTKIAFIGDSTIRGDATGGDGTRAIKSLPAQFAAKMNAYGIPAGGNSVWGSSASTFATLLSTDSRVTTTGGWSQSGNFGPGGNTITASATGNLTFTPQANVTKFDIYWVDNAAGRSINASVDGGGATLISTTAVYQIAKTTISAGTTGIHTLTLAWNAGNFTIVGIDAYDDTNGRRELSVYNWGISGANSTQMIDNSDPTAGRLAYYKYMAPDLSIIEGGIINDWRQGFDISVTKANLTTLVTTMKNYGSVLLYTPRFDNGTAGTTAQQEQYVYAQKQVAIEQSVGIIDNRSSFQSFAIANAAGFYGDTVHGDPNGVGYGDEANSVRAKLTSF